MYAAIFHTDNWFNKVYDGRKKEFKGVTREDFQTAKWKHLERQLIGFKWETRTQEFKHYKEYFRNLPFVDTPGRESRYDNFQAPSRDLSAYLEVTPEGGTRHIVTDPVIVRYLIRKYNEHFNF